MTLPARCATLFNCVRSANSTSLPRARAFLHALFPAQWAGQGLSGLRSERAQSASAPEASPRDKTQKAFQASSEPLPAEKGASMGMCSCHGHVTGSGTNQSGIKSGKIDPGTLGGAQQPKGHLGLPMNKEGPSVKVPQLPLQELLVPSLAPTPSQPTRTSSTTGLGHSAQRDCYTGESE